MKKELFNISKHLCVLYVEDDEETQSQYKKIFSVLFKEVQTANNGQEALDLYKDNYYDVIITDLTMPIMDGITMIGEILKIEPNQHIIIMTAHNSGESLRSSINFQIDGILLKPVAVDKLFQLLFKVCSTIAVEKKNSDSIYKCSEDKKVQTLLKDDNQVIFLVLVDKFNELVREFGEEAKTSIVKTVTEHLLFFGMEDGCFAKIDQGILIYSVEKKYLKDIMGSLQDFSYRHNSLISEFNKVKLHITLSYGMMISSKKHSIVDKSCKFILDHIDHIIKDIASNDDGMFISDIEPLETVKDESLKWLEETIDVLEQKTMVPFYQPIVNLHDEEIKTYEVYYRIKYGKKYILPKFFVSMSEKAGVIEEISKAVFDKAFERFSYTDLDFHINLSNENLKSTVMKNYIIYLCSKYNIKPNRVVLNVIDSQLLDAKSKSLKTLLEFKKLGYKTVLKDFGISHINLEILMILEPEYVKINQSLLKRALKNKKAKKLLSFFINYAKDVDMKTILVGVEEQEILEIGKELGFDYAQGYLLGRPSDKLTDK